ncbi:MAG: zinc-ribbon domain-containing protein [Armatimonadota bacterium]
MAEDKTLKCKDCGQDFVFSTGEQEFYAEKGFQNEPARCVPCRQAKKKERSSMSGVHFRERDSISTGQYRSSFSRNQY